MRRRRQLRDRLAAERLERRLVLSADFAGLSAGPVGQITWDGLAVEAYRDRWVVGFDAGTVGQTPVPAATPAVELGWSLIDLGGGFFSLATPGTSSHDVSQWAAGTPGVTWIEPDFALTPSRMPNDPDYSLLWGLSNDGQTGGMADIDINAPQAWDITTGSRSVVIAVVDSGVDVGHPDLAANIWRNPGEIPGNGIDDDRNGYVDDVSGWDFVSNDNTPDDGNGHGTHVAGTIGAVGNDGRGVVGVNWEVSILPLKFLDDWGFGSTAGAIAALNYAAVLRSAGVNIVATNNSWGGGGYSSALRTVIARHNEAGILFVAAAGNDGTDNDAASAYPASYDLANVISVAAIDHAGQAASFTNFGRTSVDLAAPGVDVYSTIPGSSYASFSGTSMAAPHVAGVVGLLAAANPQATAGELRAAILDTTVPVPGLAGRLETGGRLDAAAALDQIAPLAGPRVLSVLPGGVVAPPVSQLQVVFNEEILAAAVLADNFRLMAAGGDETWGTSDDISVMIPPAGIEQSPPGTVTLDLGGQLVDGDYRLTLRGTGPTPIQNLAGEPLRGGSDLTFSFSVRTPPPAPLEPNDTLATATPALIEDDESIFAGVIGDGANGLEDVDLFAVVLEAGDLLEVVVTAESTGSSLDSYLSLFDASGGLWASNDDGGSLDSRLSFVAPISGGYLVGVSGFGNSYYSPVSGDGTTAGSIGPYEVRLRRTAPNSESNDSIFEATPVPILTGATSFEGEIGDGDHGDRDVDFYGLSLLVGQRLEAAIVAAALGSTLDSRLRVFNVNGQELAASGDDGGSADSRLTFTAPESASYFIGVSGSGNENYSPLLGGTGEAGSTGGFRLEIGLSEFVPTPPPTSAPGEPNDSLFEATPLGIVSGSVSLAGFIGDGRFPTQDVDLFAVSLLVGQRLEAATLAATLGSPLDSQLRLFDVNGRELAANADAGGTTDSRFSFVAPESASYFIGVSGGGNAHYSPLSAGEGMAGSTGQFRLDVALSAFEPGPPPASEPGGTIAEAAAGLAAGSATASVTAAIGSGAFDSGDVDLYFVDLVAGDLIEAAVRARELDSPLDSYLRLFDATGNELAANDDFQGSLDSGLAFLAADSGRYYVGVSGYGNRRYSILTGEGQTAGSTGSYRLDLHRSEARAVGPTDTNDSLAEATPLPLDQGGGVITGVIGDGSHGARDVDLYRVSLEGGQTLRLGITAAAAGGVLDSYLRLFDAAGAEVAANDDAADSPDSVLAFTTTEAGVYFIGVSGFGNGDYRPEAAGSGGRGSIGSYHLDATVTSAASGRGPELLQQAAQSRATATGRIGTAAEFFRLIALLAGDPTADRD
jgi:subtilisin family serine protease